MTPFQVLDWRRKIAQLYAVVRAEGGSQSAWQHWHDERCRLVSSHPASMIAIQDRHDFAGLHVFDHNPAFRFVVASEPLSGRQISYDLGDDGFLSVRPVARTVGLADMLETELVIYGLDGYGGGIFLPFSDATSGTETYGGGRYLLDTIKGADLGETENGRLILDFNFAYFPSCAHSKDYVCPLSPPENLVPVPVKAGERWRPGL